MDTFPVLTFVRTSDGQRGEQALLASKKGDAILAQQPMDVE